MICAFPASMVATTTITRATATTTVRVADQGAGLWSATLPVAD